MSLVKWAAHGLKNLENHQLDGVFDPLEVVSTTVKSLRMSSTIIVLKDPALYEFTKGPTLVLQGRQVGDFAKIACFQRFETPFQIY